MNVEKVGFSLLLFVPGSTVLVVYGVRILLELAKKFFPKIHDLVEFLEMLL